MANFDISNAVTGRTETGYNPGINEAETLNGIDRSENPHWSGWAAVDAIKAKYPGASVKQYNALFRQDKLLMANIEAFYKSDYWDVLNLDKVKDQQIANTVYDCSVNQGTGAASHYLQQAVGVPVDHIIGPHTLEAVNTLNAETTYNKINALREAEYRAIVLKNPKKKIWLQDWLARLLPYAKVAIPTAARETAGTSSAAISEQTATSPAAPPVTIAIAQEQMEAGYDSLMKLCPGFDKLTAEQKNFLLDFAHKAADRDKQVKS